MNATMVNSLIRSIDEIESVTDSIYNMTKISEDRVNKDIVFEEEDKTDVVAYHELTRKYLEFIRKNLTNPTFRMLSEAHELENMMNDEHKRLSDKVHDRISTGGSEVRSELMLLEVERNLEHIGDYCLNIAEATFAEPKHTPTLQRVTPSPEQP